MKNQEAVKIILINKKNEFLLQLRDNIPGIVCPGQWALIGGGLEKGETPIQGLEREIKEEIPGCKICRIMLLGEGYTEISPNTYNLIGYSTSKKYNIKNSKNLIDHMTVFKGRIYEKIEKINRKLTEGQKASYFKYDDLPEDLNPFAKDFIYQNKKRIFS